MSNPSSLIPIEEVHSVIHEIRGRRVILDKDIAKLYEVPTKALLQAVKRNLETFPSDFMYQLTDKEVAILRSQFGVGLIKSVDDVCHCSLISFVVGSMLSPIVRVIEGLKPNGSAVVNPG